MHARQTYVPRTSPRGRVTSVLGLYEGKEPQAGPRNLRIARHGTLHMQRVIFAGRANRRRGRDRCRLKKVPLPTQSEAACVCNPMDSIEAPPRVRAHSDRARCSAGVRAGAAPRALLGPAGRPTGAMRASAPPPMHEYASGNRRCPTHKLRPHNTGARTCAAAPACMRAAPQRAGRQRRCSCRIARRSEGQASRSAADKLHGMQRCGLLAMRAAQFYRPGIAPPQRRREASKNPKE